MVYRVCTEQKKEKGRGTKKRDKERYLGHSAEVGNWGNAGEAVICGKHRNWGRSTLPAATEPRPLLIGTSDAVRHLDSWPAT